MKKYFISTILVVSAAIGNMYAQVPNHDMYINFTNSKQFADYFSAWSPGSKVSEDDEFFISRIKKKDRFTNAQTQVNTSFSTDRKVSWWVPCGENSKVWGPLPRYMINADNFSSWSYIDDYANWSNSWIRVPGAFSDACHKNGVTNGCLVFFETSLPTDIFNLMTEAQAQKWAKFMMYYGIDGLGINPEASLGTTYASRIKTFLEALHKETANIGWHCNIVWYEAQTNSGGVSWTDQLSSNNYEWFQRYGKSYPVSDVFFLNYNWTKSKLQSSQTLARQLGRSSYDVYAGFDMQGRWLHSNLGEGAAGAGWEILPDYEVSLGFWGNHSKNMILENSGEFGSEGSTLMTTYLKKQEQFFTGGTHNPVNSPDVTNRINASSLSALSKFHGISKFTAARSTLQELPFVTYFGLGNGKFFNKEGVENFDKEWYNIGIQDICPTWRWWWTSTFMGREATDVSTDMDAQFTYDDAYYGGSSLAVSGATEKAYLQLFKTKFALVQNDEITVRYKIVSGTGSMELTSTAEGEEPKEITGVIFGNAGVSDGWLTKTLKVGARSGIALKDKTAALLGLKFTNTTPDFKVLLGGLSVVPASSSFAPALPTITSSTILKGTYNTCDFKLVWKSAEPKANAWEPTYNDEVDTWIFEVYSQQQGEEPVLCTSTTQWAAYVVGAPVSSEDKSQRFGVRAVAPDGETASEIVWTNYQTRTITQVETINIDKPIIKTNEMFSLKFDDVLHENSKWEVVNSATGEVEYTALSATVITTSLPKEGSYDVKITLPGGAVNNFRGYIQISPAKTGAIPVIGNISSNKSEMSTGDVATVSYTAERLGEGSVSRAVRVQDPQMLRLPQLPQTGAPPYTFAFWFKADNLTHGSEGINLLDKRTLSDAWANNNWGDIWVTIRPQGLSGLDNRSDWQNFKTLGKANANEISANVYGWHGRDQYCWDFLTHNYAVNLDVWTHFVLTLDGNGRMKIYFNGNKVIDDVLNYGFSDPVKWVRRNGPVYVGGTSVYKSGFNGWVDEFQIWNKALSDAEVLECMKGYRAGSVPSNLIGYWNFEELNENKWFPNLGSLGDNFTVTTYNYDSGSQSANPAIISDGRAYVITTDASGESTASATEIYVEANNTEMGTPTIDGTLNVVTAPVWDMPGASTAVPNDNSVGVTYDIAGKYTAKLRLENSWGSDTQELKDFVTVVGTGIEESGAIGETNVYPNPFTDYVNMMFTEAGGYVCDIVASDGKLIETKDLTVSSDEIVRIDINGQQGVYFLRIKNSDGSKVLRSVKLIKR